LIVLHLQKYAGHAVFIPSGIVIGWANQLPAFQLSQPCPFIWLEIVIFRLLSPAETGQHGRIPF